MDVKRAPTPFTYNLEHLRNSIIVLLPATDLPAYADGLRLAAGVQVTLLNCIRRKKITIPKALIRQDGEYNLFQQRLQDDSDIWALQLLYKEPFGFVDFMDFRAEKLDKLLHTLSLMFTVNWRDAWVIHLYHTQKRDFVVMASRATDIWYLGEQGVHAEECEPITLPKLQMYGLYRRRVGQLLHHGNSPLFIAIQFYWSHFGLPSHFIRILALWIVMEALFNVSNAEISQTMRLATAHLLGRTVDNKLRISADIGKLYGERSRIIHGQPKLAGKGGEDDYGGLYLLHDYVRKSLRSIVERRSLFQTFLDDTQRRNAINAALIQGHF